MQALSFNEWKEEVDLAIEKQCGMSADDLPDVPYRDMYEGGDTPEQAARYAIRYAQDLDPDNYDDEEGIWATDEE